MNKDSEYLAKPLIEGAEFTIGDDYIKISSPSTIHAESRRVLPITKEEFTSLYKSVLRVAKFKKVKISYRRHIRRDSINKWEEYIGACRKARELFIAIIKQAIVVRERGLHYGTIDDYELGKLQNLCEENRSFFYAASIVSRVAEDYFKLKSISQGLEKSGSEEMTIYL